MLSSNIPLLREKNKMSVLTASETSIRSLKHLDKLFEALTAETAPAFTGMLNSTKGEPLQRLTLAAISRLNFATVALNLPTAKDFTLLTIILAKNNLEGIATQKEMEVMLNAAGESSIQRILMIAISLYLAQEPK